LLLLATEPASASVENSTQIVDLDGIKNWQRLYALLFSIVLSWEKMIAGQAITLPKVIDRG